MFKFKNIKGMTLVELMIAVCLLGFCISGLIATYYNSFILNETSKNQTLALNAISAKLEEIKDKNFAVISGDDNDIRDYDNESFDMSSFPAGSAKGYIEVIPEAYADLLRVRITATWRQRPGRIIGWDTNLNGALDPGEVIKSPVEVVTRISANK